MRRDVAGGGEQNDGIESERKIPPGGALLGQGGLGGCKLIFELLHRERLAYGTGFWVQRELAYAEIPGLSGDCYSAEEITEAQRRKAVRLRIAYMIMDSDA